METGATDAVDGEELVARRARRLKIVEMKNPEADLALKTRRTGACDYAERRKMSDSDGPATACNDRLNYSRLMKSERSLEYSRKSRMNEQKWSEAESRGVLKEWRRKSRRHFILLIVTRLGTSRNARELF